MARGILAKVIVSLFWKISDYLGIFQLDSQNNMKRFKSLLLQLINDQCQPLVMAVSQIMFGDFEQLSAREACIF